MLILLSLIIGLILGGASIWLIMRSQIQGIKFQKQAYDEKINLYISQRETLSQETKEQKSKIEQLEVEIRSILSKSSDADAKVARLLELQQELQVKTKEIQNFQSEITAQKENISRLTTDLENKEQSAKQKINELNADSQKINAENNRYREKIELANQKSAEANAQKEKLNQLMKELEDKKRENQELQSEKIKLTAQLSSLSTQLEEERKSTQEKSDLLKNIEQKFTNTFEVLSSRALQHNNKQFLEVAKETFANIHQSSHNQINNLVLPLNKSLEEFQKQIRDIENARQEDRGQISEKLESVTLAQLQLQAETANLSKALRQPIVRGRWGEVQLKRVVEMSGMQEHCDFTIQETVHTEDGSLRPDLIVKLPGKKQIIVDSKAPLKSYLEAIEAQEESIQLEYLKNHAGHIRTHIKQLSSKNYWQQFEQTPEFVIMFLPGEVFFSAALQQDPRLIEFGIEKKVILATPTTLITLLKTIEYGWRQEIVAENAQAIGNLGQELYDRFIKFTDHLITVRKKLDDTVKAYNTTIGSYESRLLVTARKFQAIGGYGDKEMENAKLIERSVKPLTQEYNSKT